MHPLLFVLFGLSVIPLSSHAHPIAENSFEEPAVPRRTPKAEGGDPSQAPAPANQSPFWESFEDHPNIGGECGAIVAGLTNQIARSGSQSLFVEAANLCAPYIGVHWASRPISIEAGKYYRITLWGRAGARPSAQGAQPPAPLYLNIQVSFYSGQEGGETGENLYIVRPLQRPNRCGPGLNAKKWTPLGFTFEAPKKASSFIISFRCDGRASKGVTNATVYFDDFSVTEEFPPSEETTIASHARQKPCKAMKAKVLLSSGLPPG